MLNAIIALLNALTSTVLLLALLVWEARCVWRLWRRLWNEETDHE